MTGPGPAWRAVPQDTQQLEPHDVLDETRADALTPDSAVVSGHIGASVQGTRPLAAHAGQRRRGGIRLDAMCRDADGGLSPQARGNPLGASIVDP